MHSIKMESIASSSLISSAVGFGNDRNNDTNFDNACDFMIVIHPKRVCFRFDHCFNIDLTLFKNYTALEFHIS